MSKVKALLIGVSLALAGCATGPLPQVAGGVVIHQAPGEEIRAELVEVPGRWFLFTDVETPASDDEARRGVMGAMPVVDAKIESDGLGGFGPPIMDKLRAPAAGRAGFRAGRFTREEPKTPLIGLGVARVQGSTAIRFTSTGSFAASASARAAMSTHLRDRGLIASGPLYIEILDNGRHAVVQPVSSAPTS